jgi:hypothetical protein
VKADAVLSPGKRLTRAQEAKSEQVKLRSPIHLPLHAFETIDLSFDLALAPRQRTCSKNRRTILLHTPGQAFEFGYVALLCPSEPVAQFVGFLMGEDVDEVLAECLRQSQIWTGLAELLNLSAHQYSSFSSVVVRHRRMRSFGEG